MTLIKPLPVSHDLHLRTFALSVAASFCAFVAFRTLIRNYVVERTRKRNDNSTSQLAGEDIKLTSYIVSTIHAVVAIYGGWRVYFHDPTGAAHDGFMAAFGNADERNFYLMIVCGYLFYGKCSMYSE